MKTKSKLLTFLMLSISMMSFSGCGLFGSDPQNSDSNSTSQTTSTINPTIEDPYNSLGFLDYNVKDLDFYQYSNGSIRKEYILTKPSQPFTLEISFINPDQFVITEFEINDVVYSQSKITASPDYCKINISMQAQADYGVQLYTIQGFKYIKNNKEIYSKLTKKTFVLRLDSKQGISIDDFSYTAKSTSLNVNLTIKDPDNVSKTLPLHYRLIDKDGSNEEDKYLNALKVGQNSFEIKNLKEFNSYDLVIYYGRFLQYEFGTDTFIDIQSFPVKTLRAIDIVNIVPEYEKVTFQIKNIDNVAISQMYLKNKKTNLQEIISHSPVEEFNSIKSDTEYAIGVVFKLNNNEFTREFDFKTKAYVAPTFKFAKYEAKYQTISYEVDFKDPYKVGSFVGVVLVGYPGPMNTDLKGTFHNCNSGYYYRLILKYAYDLHDGNGVISKQVEQEIYTKKLDTSDIALKLSLSGKNAIDYEFDTKNRHDVTLNKVELFYYGEVKQSIENPNKVGTFLNLVNNKEYTLKASYTVDLPGEESDYHGVMTSKIVTNKLKDPVFNLSMDIGRKDVSYNLILDDKDNVFTFFETRLYKGEELIDTSIKFKDTFANLISGTTYLIKVYYKLNYNDNTYPGITSKDYEFTTETFSAPAFSIDNVEIGPDYFIADVKLDDPTNSLVPGSIYAYVIDNNVNRYETYLIDDYTTIRLSGLCSCTSHSLVIRYEYDLNEGEGKQYKAFIFNFTTLKQIIVTKFSITKENNCDANNCYFNIHILFKNPDKLYFDRIIINGITLNLESIPTDEINLRVGDIFNYNNHAGGNTLDGFITTLGERYDVYLKNPW